MISGESIQLIVTKSGFCAIPVRWYSTMLNNVTTGQNKRNPIDIWHKYDKGLKLLRNLAHPPPDKLMKLINSVAEHWEKNEKLDIYIKNLSGDGKSLYT